MTIAAALQLAASKSQCDCCGKVAFLRRGEVTGIETWACAECHGYPADDFDEEDES